MDVGDFLRKLGLQEHEAAFRDNGIDIGVLPNVTAEDLKDLGITMVGHRRVLLQAIAALRAPTAPAVKAGPEGLDAAPMRGPQVASTATAERRQVTIMFCDLVGSTELASRLDPEDLRAVIGRYHACVAQTVSRFDGFVAKFMGDGVLAYFGYPQAHEDDPEQAVRAGLALIDAVGELQAAEPLQVRIGIATGLVVVGDLIGVGSAQEQAIVGETPNLAARLQALAGPNAVIIAESTRRQIIGRAGVNIAIEVGIRQGWDAIIGTDGIFIGMSGFGASGPYQELYKHFGITAEHAAAAAPPALCHTSWWGRRLPALRPDGRALRRGEPGRQCRGTSAAPRSRC